MSFIIFTLFVQLLCISASTLCFWPFTQEQTKPFSIMLDPAGDAQTTGRIIDDNYERGVTLQLCEDIKKQLEAEQPKNTRIVLTRFPGETIDPLQNANFANRLDIDAYISIHLYQQKESPSTLCLYHFLLNPTTDLWNKVHKLSFIPYDQAHIVHLSKTIMWADHFKNILKQEQYRNAFEIKGPYGLPFRPLIGIKAPAIAIEIGLKNKADVARFVDPIVQCLKHLILIAGS